MNKTCLYLNILFILWVLFYSFSVFIQYKDCITHDNKNDVDIDVNSRIEQIKKKDKLAIDIADEIQILKQLNTFDLGRFLLKNKGFDGYWISYVINARPIDLHSNMLEKWILFTSPGIKATRERFYIFRQQLHKYLQSNMRIASIPCGMMDDLLNLNYADLHNIEIVGIDIDKNSIILAMENAGNKNIINVNFIEQNAWTIDFHEYFNIITSNGLNIYEVNKKKLIDLYRRFYKALKKGGIFITSFITPSPISSENSIWKSSIHDMKKEHAIFFDIVQIKVANFQTEDAITLQLKEVGFEIVEIIYDSQCIFPTVIAKKV